MNEAAESVSDSAIFAGKRVRDITEAVHIRLLTADMVRLPQGRWRSRNVLDPYWRLYRNEDEGAGLRIGGDGGGTYPLRAGTVYFVPAGVRFSCENSTAFRHFYMHFDLGGLPRPLIRTLFAMPVQIPRDSEWEASVEAFAREIGGSPELDLPACFRAKALIYEGLARYLAIALPAVQDQLFALTRDAEAISPALEYIEAHLAEPFGIAELADRCCLSPDYFAKRFRDCLGQTPLHYVRERRVALAARRLLFTDDSLETIASGCGFGSRFYLTRIFVRLMGVPPAAYRKAGPRM